MSVDDFTSISTGSCPPFQEDLGQLISSDTRLRHHRKMGKRGDRENLRALKCRTSESKYTMSKRFSTIHLVFWRREKPIGNYPSPCLSLYSDLLPSFHLPQLFLIST